MAFSWTPKRTLAECEALMTGPGAMFEMQLVDIDVNGTPTQLRAYKNLWPNTRSFWLTSSKTFADKTYIVYEGERWTYGEAHDSVVEIANLLYHTYGCRKGDTIAIAARNSPEWILVHWAIQLIGAVIVAVNAWIPNETMEFCIASTSCKVAFMDGERAQALQGSVKSLQEAGVSKLVVWREKKGSLPKGFLCYEDELEAVLGQKEVPPGDTLPEDNATIFFTSGTTGLPKGVLGSQRQILTNILNSIGAGVRSILRRGDNVPAPDPALPQKGNLLSVPLFHATGTHGSLYVMTAAGGKVAMMYKWNTEKAAELIMNEKLTGAGGLPFMAMELLDSKLGRGNHSLESIGYGGGPVSEKLAGNILERLGTTMPGQGYGSTEVNCAAANFVGEDYLARPTSTGLPCPVNDFKILSDNGQELGPGQQGEIYIRGVNVAKGYWKNPEATKEVFLPGGWYRSGDLGMLDEEGFVYILDRAKDIIIRGGENIASVNVENALFADTRILDATVVAVKDAKLGELVAASVVTRPGYHDQVLEQDLIQQVAKLLPRHMVPVMVDVRKETFPRNGVGKTLKKALRDELDALWQARIKGGKAKL